MWEVGKVFYADWDHGSAFGVGFFHLAGDKQEGLMGHGRDPHRYLPDYGIRRAQKCGVRCVGGLFLEVLSG